MSNAERARETLSAPIMLDEADWSVELSRDVSVASHSFLESHVMNGRAVLPVAMMVEWLAHAALHPHPGKRFCGFDALRVLKGLRLNGQTITLALETAPARAFEAAHGGLRVPTRLSSVNESGRRVVHCAADILLGDQRPSAEMPIPLPDSGFEVPDTKEIYTHQLFHGPALAGIESIERLSEEGLVAVVHQAPAPATWMDNPLRGSWLADPLALDVGFQLMIVWTQTVRGEGSLPAYIENYRQYERSFGGTEPLRAVVRVTYSGQRKARADIEWLTSEGTVIAAMHGYECVIDGSLNRAFARNHLLGASSRSPASDGHDGAAT